MKKRFLAFLTVLIVSVTIFCIPAFADSSPSVYLIDECDAINDVNEKEIKDKAREVADKTGFNIVIVATDNIGTPKTDAHVVEYADDKYEELCGIDTDGILFLINCDTKYDYISTSGVCINYFSDNRIDTIFDRIWDHLKEENFAQAAYSFVCYVDKYYDMGKANDDHYIFAGETAIRISPTEIMRGMLFGGIFVLIFGTSAYKIRGAQYKVQKPGTRNYILDNSLVFDNQSDVYVGRTVHTTYTPRSSSSGSHHSGGHHHSSVHRSHSGGHHGGGGRHR